MKAIVLLLSACSEAVDEHARRRWPDSRGDLIRDPGGGRPRNYWSPKARSSPYRSPRVQRRSLLISATSRMMRPAPSSESFPAPSPVIRDGFARKTGCSAKPIGQSSHPSGRGLF